jgi:hypothetical protein
MKYETDTEYHAQSDTKPRIGSTALKTFMANPMLFGGQYVTKDIPFPEPLPAFAIGHAVEAIVYGWADKVLASGFKTAASKGHKEAVEANADKIVLTDTAYDEVYTIADAVRKTEQYRIMMQSGKAQMVERVDMETFTLQAKYDWIITEPTSEQVDLFGDGHIIIDFKTTANLRSGFSNFERSIGNFGYIEQAALYQIIHEHNTDRLASWFWFAVEKQQPYEAQMFKADPNWLEVGRAAVFGSINKLKQRFESNDWRNSTELVETLYQPSYAKLL